jgi:hypothetical protein
LLVVGIKTVGDGWKATSKVNKRFKHAQDLSRRINSSTSETLKLKIFTYQQQWAR